MQGKKEEDFYCLRTCMRTCTVWSVTSMAHTDESWLGDEAKGIAISVSRTLNEAQHRAVGLVDI